MKLIATEYISFTPHGDHLLAILGSGLILIGIQGTLLTRHLKRKKDEKIRIVAFSLLFFLLSTFWYAWASFQDLVNTEKAKHVLNVDNTPYFSPDPFLLSTWAYLILFSAVGPLVVLTTKHSNQSVQTTETKPPSLTTPAPK